MAQRLAWHITRFTTINGGPAYVDLLQVAAVLDTLDPKGRQAVLDVGRGSTIYMNSGAAFYVMETADAVFEELHRARVKEPPAIEKIRMDNAPGPLPDQPHATPAPIAAE